MLYLLDIRRNDGNLNLKKEFCNWTNVEFLFKKIAVGFDICDFFSVWRQTPSDFYDFWCMKSWDNLTAEDYKFTHLTCILWPHYLEKCKKSFATMLFMCFRMFRLLLNKIDYSCHSAAVSEVTFFIKSVRSDLPLRGHNYGVCYATVRSLHPRCSTGIQSTPCLSQPLPQLNHDSHAGVHAHATCPRCDKPSLRTVG